MLRRRFLLPALGVPAFAIVLCAAFLAWAATTESGLRFAARMIEEFALPGLGIERPSGVLLGGHLHIGRLVYSSAQRRIEAKEVSLWWQPRRLRDGALAIDKLEIGELDIVGGDDEPIAAPNDLGLPLPVSLSELHISRIRWGKLAGRQGQSLAEVTEVAARFASDGQRHVLERLHFNTARLAFAAGATLSGVAPFDVAANARITGEARGHAFVVGVDAAGTLRALALAARSASGALDLRGAATLDLFAPQALQRGSLNAVGLDPAAWVDGAPHALLRVDARVTPEPGGAGFRGEISAFNSEPGRLDQKRLPLRRFDAVARQDGSRIAIPAFTATLTGGSASGSAAWANQQLSVDAQLIGVDAAAWHKALKKTRLNGGLAAQVSAATQSLHADLSDPRFTLKLDLSRARGIVHIVAARLAARGQSLEISGEVDPQGPYDIRGDLRQFDAAAYFAVPRGRLNATLQARGRLGREPSMDLHFALRDSQIAGRAISGQGDVVARPQRLERADVTLLAGDNRLVAQGRLAGPGDALTLTIDAPHLEQLGLGGALRGEVKLTGALSAPAAEWTIQSPYLTLPERIELRDLASRGTLNSGGAAIDVQLTLARLSRGSTALAGLALTIEGQRSRHRIRLATRIGNDNDIELAASGGLERNWLWKGAIDSLAWRGAHPVRLAGPTSLEAGAGRIVVGQAVLLGADWQGNIDGLSWQAGRMQSAGRVRGLPAASLLGDAARASSLRLGGEWNFDLGQHAAGRVHLFREHGDVALKVGDESFSLGLTDLDLGADFKGETAEIALRAHGAQAGTLAGHISARLRREQGAWTLARDAPWRGKLELDTPSLAWLSPLVGENVVLGGRLRGNVDLGGTPDRPVTRGQLAGDGLRLHMLEHGLDLGGGAMLLDLTPEKARLQRLEFVTVPSQRPAAQRVDVGQLMASPGRLSAEGEVDVKTGSGLIRLRAERVALSQLPNRWLMASGSGGIRFAARQLSGYGSLRVDAAYVELAPAARPSLAPDVVVIGRDKAKAAAPPIDLDLKVSLGERFHFHGAGIDSRLAGELRLSAQSRDQLRAVGSVHTVKGSFDAYGRELAIERGILNFQGLVDNPGLNVRALRKNQPVEAGVEVTGLLKSPKVRLVSVPEVPDSEKLSWMVLGRGPGESISSKDADLMLAAAMALRGGGEGKGPLQSLMQGLGLEELSLSSGTLGEGGRFPSTHVAGSFDPGGGTSTAQQIATVGKRLGRGVVLTYERSVTTAESLVKLTVELTRRLSLVGRVGTDNAIGLIYSFTFGGGETEGGGEEEK